MVKAKEVEVKPFTVNDFNQVNVKDIRTVSKKELKALAQKIGLTYDDKQIIFAKKLITAYFK